MRGIILCMVIVVLNLNIYSQDSTGTITESINKPKVWKPSATEHEVPVDWFGNWETPGRIRIQPAKLENLPLQDRKPGGLKQPIKIMGEEHIPKAFLNKAFREITQELKAKITKIDVNNGPAGKRYPGQTETLKRTKAKADKGDILTHASLNYSSSHGKFMLVSIWAGIEEFDESFYGVNREFLTIYQVLLEDGKEVWRREIGGERAGYFLTPWGHLLVTWPNELVGILDKHRKVLHKFQPNIDLPQIAYNSDETLMLIGGRDIGRKLLLDSNSRILWDKELEVGGEAPPLLSKTGKYIAVGRIVYSREGKPLWKLPCYVGFFSSDERNMFCRSITGLVYDLQKATLTFTTAEIPDTGTYQIVRKTVACASPDNRYLILAEENLLRVYDWKGNLYAMEYLEQPIHSLIPSKEGIVFAELKDGKTVMELDISPLQRFKPVESQELRMERLKVLIGVTSQPQIESETLKAWEEGGKIFTERTVKRKISPSDQYYDKYYKLRGQVESTLGEHTFSDLTRELPELMREFENGYFDLKRP